MLTLVGGLGNLAFHMKTSITATQKNDLAPVGCQRDELIFMQSHLAYHLGSVSKFFSPKRMCKDVLRIALQKAFPPRTSICLGCSCVDGSFAILHALVTTVGARHFSVTGQPS